MHMFIQKLSKSHLIFPMCIFDGLFITFFRRHWYRKKRFDIPICSLILLLIAGIIIGSVLGTKAKTTVIGTIFDIFLF
jgi:hypothetical protein